LTPVNPVATRIASLTERPIKAQYFYMGKIKRSGKRPGKPCEKPAKMKNPDKLIVDKGHGAPLPLRMAHAAAQGRVEEDKLTATQGRVLSLLKTISPSGIKEPTRLSTEEIVEWLQRPDWQDGMAERLDELVQTIDAQALSTLLMLLGPDNTSYRVKMRATEVALKLTGRLIERQEHQHTIGLAEQLLANANPVMPRMPDSEARIIDIEPVLKKD